MVVDVALILLTISVSIRIFIIITSGGNLAPSLRGRKNFSRTKMRFFLKNFHFGGKNF